jgi:hypothetical protein
MYTKNIIKNIGELMEQTVDEKIDKILELVKSVALNHIKLEKRVEEQQMFIKKLIASSKKRRGEV